MRYSQILLLATLALVALANGQKISIGNQAKDLINTSKKDMASMIVELANQVSVLTNDVVVLKKRFADMNNTLSTCGCHASNVTKNVTRSKNVTTSPGYEINRLQIMSYTRFYRYANYSVIFSMKNNNTKIPKTSWVQLNNDFVNTKLDDFQFAWRNPREITSYSLPKIANQTRIVFTIGTSKVWYNIYMNNSLARNVTFTNLSLPEMTIIPEDIVYTIGQNVSFRVKASSNVKDVFVTDQYLTNVGSRTFAEGVQYHIDKIVTNKETPTNETVYNITLHTATFPLRGVFTLLARAKSNIQIPFKAQESRRLVIRPRGQTRPFTDGMFAFSFKYTTRDRNGNLTKRCYNNKRCSLTCPLAVGSNKTEMSVRFLTRRGWQSISDVIEDPFYISEFSADIPQDVEEAHCKATDLRYNASISETIQIEWVNALRITSGWTVKEKNGRSRTTVRFYCSAKGTPVPNVRISLAEATTNYFKTFYAPKIDVKTNDSITVYQVVTIPKRVFRKYWYAECEAWNQQGLVSKIIH